MADARTSEAPRVVVYGRGYDDYSIEVEVLRTLGVTRIESVAEGAWDELARATAVLVRETPVPADVIDRLDACRAIVRYGIGVDSVDLTAASRRGIYVANVPDYGVDEVSTHALALYLAVVRQVVTRDRAVRAGTWDGTPRPMPPRVAGSTVGVVGLGRIGEALHRKARGIGFERTLAYDPYRTTWPDGVEPCELDRLFAQADLVSLHVPLRSETVHLVDARRLALMKPTAVLVNTARGGLVDEGALVEALRRGALLGAGLDVLEREPPERSHELLAEPSVVVTDHVAWSSAPALAELHRRAAEEVRRVLSGEPPASWVNRWAP